MKDKIAIAVAGFGLASWVSYMVVYPSPDAVHWGETYDAHTHRALLEATRKAESSATTVAAK